MARRQSRRRSNSVVTRKRSVSKKRTRLKLKWKPIFWLLFFIQLLAGLIWSRVTSPRVIYVRDTETFDRERINRKIQFLKGYPFLQIPNKKIEGLIGNNSSIKTCELRINIFGRGSLNIQRRAPIARLDGYKNVYLDHEGVVFVIPTEHKMLPPIRLAECLRIKNFTVSGVWESQKVAQVCLKCSKWLQGRPFALEVDGRGLILLDLQGLTKVFLGSFENIEEKLDVLNQWIKKDEDFLRGIKTLNLSVPKSPTYTPQ